MCKWCARAYQDRKHLLHEMLDRRIQTPADLIQEMEAHENFRQLGGFPSMTEINFVSGDFKKTELFTQAEYLIEFIQRVRKLGFRGEWYYAGHQAFKKDDIVKLKKAIGDGTMCYTLEHLTRRGELMPVKGLVPLDDVTRTLIHTSKIMGKKRTQYYLIAGLDPFPDVEDWVTRHTRIAIPQIHVFTPYAPSHYRLAHGERSVQMETALKVRSSILRTYGRAIHSGSNRSLFSVDET